MNEENQTPTDGPGGYEVPYAAREWESWAMSLVGCDRIRPRSWHDLRSHISSCYSLPGEPTESDWDSRKDGTSIRWVCSDDAWPRSITKITAKRLILDSWRRGVRWAVANPEEAAEYGPNTVPLSIGTQECIDE